MARQSRSHVMSMLIIFFDCEGVVHYEFASRGQTINKEYYVEVLKRLRDMILVLASLTSDLDSSTRV